MTTKAFTLVELAIVMTIIGLLIGGILKGQELLENARVTATIAQVKSFQAALNTFQDVYDRVIPGDMSNALNRIPNCTAATACQNGNGNGEIDIASFFHDNKSNLVSTDAGQFWKHLALANLISGVNGAAATEEWGSSHPASRLGGGFIAQTPVSIPDFAGDPGAWMKGIVVTMRNNVNGITDAWRYMTPQRAGQIDRKMDDGMADTGTVHGVSNSWTSGCGPHTQPSNGTTGYNETLTTKVCEISIEIGS